MTKKIYSGVAILLFGLLSAQTITYKGCYPLFNEQDFIFTKTGTDSYGKGIYLTSPIDGQQPCGGLGICEFKISWNNSSERWEFLADKGNGDFVDPYLIFFNATGGNDFINPPSASAGQWLENVAITEGECGGPMTTANSTFAGDVHTSTLSSQDLKVYAAKIYPNPVKDILNIVDVKDIYSIKIFDVQGRLMYNEKGKSQLDVSKLSKGLYILVLETKDSKNQEIKFIKN